MARRPHANLIEEWLADDSIVIEARSPDTNIWSLDMHPAWLSNWQYRRKPARVYPVTSMTESQLCSVYNYTAGSFGDLLTHVANAAIKRYIDDCEAKK